MFYMPLLIVILGILLLFVLIAKFKLNAFISFIIVCVFVGVFQGMELDRIETCGSRIRAA